MSRMVDYLGARLLVWATRQQSRNQGLGVCRLRFGRGVQDLRHVMLIARRRCAAVLPPHFEPVIPAEDLDNPEVLASLIDHTLLRPEATRGEVSKLCEEAREFGFCAVCVNPFWVRLAAEELADTKVHVCTVVGFPLGANESETKFGEARMALERGAVEIDLVQNIGALRAGDFDLVGREIGQIAKLAHERSALAKVILETCLLSREEKLAACRVAAEAGADFVKTSTGFSKEGARVEDVVLMRRAVGGALGVKASGGIRTLSSLREMVAAGADRIGTSSGVKIVAEARRSVGAELQN